MFDKNKKEKNKFGYTGYCMKEKYNADELVVGNLQRISNRNTEFFPVIETTKQKYIFEPITENGIISYREIFTGFIVKSDDEEIFNLPYIVNISNFTEFIPESKGFEIPKLSLIWALNDINYPIKKSKNNDLKREKTKQKKN